MRIERRIWHIGTLVTLVLVLLSTRIVYWQLVRGNDLQPVVLDPLQAVSRNAEDIRKDSELSQALQFLIGSGPTGDLQSLPQPVVQRTRELLEGINRGAIYDRNGQLLAYDVTDDNGEVSRYYTEPSMAHLIGYTSGLRTGIAGLEQAYNRTLLGLDRPLSQLEQIVHYPVTGSDLYLTVDSRLQREAEAALSGRTGAVVLLNGETGAVLAMASTPRFDPNRMLEAGYVPGLLQSCGESSDCQGIFLNRAAQALYTPGSTWKTVTLIAALDTGQVSEETVFDFGKPVSGPNGSYYVYRVDGGEIPDPNHKESKLILELAYAKSANAAFAQMADEMPPQTLIDYAARLGFSHPNPNRFPLEIPYTPSQLANEVDSLHENNLLRAATGIGQGELLATPLNMAMVVLAVVNEGDLPLPYFVESIQDPSGRVRDGRVEGRVLRNIMKEKTAEQVKAMMHTVVEQGSGGIANISGLYTGGKTGTAQLGGEAQPHAWFIGYAEKDGRSVVISVLVENAGQGSQAAAPIFAQLAGVALDQLSEPAE